MTVLRAHVPRTVRALAGLGSQPFHVRVTATFAVVAVLHLVGAVSLGVALVTAPGAAAAALGLAGLVYVRGLVHAFDVDHVSMIDNSTRKLVTEGGRPASIGLAFSAGHSTVVVLTGVLVVAGAGAIRSAFDPAGATSTVLAAIGLGVSAVYLLLVAVANAAAFRAAWRLRRRIRLDPATRVDPGALTPRGAAAFVMTVPLRRVRRPAHVYVVGMLFSLGFDTSSQVGLLILTASAALTGAPAVALLALPFLFAAAMTLADSVNGLLMLRLYDAAVAQPAERLRFNLLITGASIASAVSVAALSVSTLLGDVVKVRSPLVDALRGIDTTYLGYGLAVFFAGTGVVVLAGRRRRPLSAGAAAPGRSRTPAS